MNNTRNHTNIDPNDALERRLRDDAHRAMRPAPTGLRSRVMHDIVAAGRPTPAHTPLWRSVPVLSAAGVALAASLILLVSAAVVTPTPAPTPPIDPAPESTTTSGSLFALFDRIEKAPRDAPNRIITRAVGGEMDRLKQDADRAAQPLLAAWKPIKAILATQ